MLTNPCLTDLVSVSCWFRQCHAVSPSTVRTAYGPLYTVALPVQLLSVVIGTPYQWHVLDTGCDANVYGVLSMCDISFVVAWDLWLGAPAWPTKAEVVC